MRAVATVLLAALVGAASLGAQSPTEAPPSGTAASLSAAALGAERSVPVARRALARGESLKPSDYDIVSVTVRQALRSAAAAESGWVTRRTIAAGEPLVEPAVGPPALVTAGQPVTFVADADGIHLSIRGTAATAGSLGQSVWVHMDSGRRLRGVVTAPGTVRADTNSPR